MIYLDPQPLGELMSSILARKGVNETSVNHVVNSLISTSLRGTDSHGINLFPHYCRAVDSGRINANPSFRFNQTAQATGILDADHGFGHHSGAHAMDCAVTLAKDAGIGAVAVTHSTHFGAAAYFALRAAHENCLGFAFTNADALVKAHHAKSAFFGTNPICFSAPLANEAPFCLDMATSRISWNKIKNARRNKESIAPGYAFDEDGLPVTDPNEARSLAPAGDYKGFGLGMMVDILCALLANGPISKALLPMYDSPIEARRNISHFFMAIDISRFVPVQTFVTHLQAMVDSIRAMTPSEPNQPVMVAGDPEKQEEARRRRSGIPIDQEMMNEFLAVSPKFSRTVTSSC